MVTSSTVQPGCRKRALPKDQFKREVERGRTSRDRDLGILTDSTQTASRVVLRRDG